MSLASEDRISCGLLAQQFQDQGGKLDLEFLAEICASSIGPRPPSQIFVDFLFECVSIQDSSRWSQTIFEALKRTCPPYIEKGSTSMLQWEKWRTLGSCMYAGEALKLTFGQLLNIAELTNGGSIALCRDLLEHPDPGKQYIIVCCNAIRACKKLGNTYQRAKSRKLLSLMTAFGVIPVKKVFEMVSSRENALSEDPPILLSSADAINYFLLDGQVSAVSYRHRQNFQGRDRSSDRQKAKAFREAEKFFWIDKNVRDRTNNDMWFKVGLLPYLVLGVRNLDDEPELNRPWIFLEHLLGQVDGHSNVFGAMEELVANYIFGEIPIDSKYEYANQMDEVFLSIFCSTAGVREAGLISDTIAPEEFYRILRLVGEREVQLEQETCLHNLSLKKFGKLLPDNTCFEFLGRCTYESEGRYSWVVDGLLSGGNHIHYLTRDLNGAAFAVLLASRECLGNPCLSRHETYGQSQSYRQMADGFRMDRRVYANTSWVYDFLFHRRCRDGVLTATKELNIIDVARSSCELNRISFVTNNFCIREVKFCNGLMNSNGIFLEDQRNIDNVLSKVRECFAGMRSVVSILQRTKPPGCVQLRLICFVAGEIAVVPALNRGFKVLWSEDGSADVLQQWEGRMFAPTQEQEIDLRLNLIALSQKIPFS